jgi:hypothetical protein
MKLLSQDRLHEKHAELNRGQEVGSPTYYLWECGPIEQGVSLEAVCPHAEYICYIMLAKEKVNEPGEAQYEVVCGSYFALVQRQFALN